MTAISDMDGMAFEYVLGTLDRNERAEVAALRTTDAALDAAIVAWEKRLGPLSEETAEAIPSADLFAKIERRIFTQPQIPVSSILTSLNRRLSFWRSMALAASLAFIIMAGGMLLGIWTPGGAPQFVAVLQKDADAPVFLVGLNEKTSVLTVRAVSATPPSGKSYELWLIAEGAKAPRSLGVLPSQGSELVPLTKIDQASVRKATLAVSVEPLGGSPTGAPTGLVVFTGKFVQAAL
jgi:anti-sigma-K factor RskA